MCPKGLAKLVVFTDLDGTLLDRNTYSSARALPGVEWLRSRGIPLVFCSSKTRAEQEAHRRELGVSGPFIVENGGAIFIPQGYFSFRFDYHKAEGSYQVIELGASYREIRQALERIRDEAGVAFRGFGDMSAEEVAAATGLELDAARRAQQREYDETLKLEGSPEEIERVMGAIEAAGLHCVYGGRYYDVMGPNDKGRATRMLADLYRRQWGRVQTAGIGDSLNDLPMLQAVDIPFLVQQPGGVWEEMVVAHLRRVAAVGPDGWLRAVEELAKGVR